MSDSLYSDNTLFFNEKTMYNKVLDFSHGHTAYKWMYHKLKKNNKSLSGLFLILHTI